MKRRIVFTMLAMLFAVSAFAQFDSIVKNYRQGFDQFRKDIEQEHRQFKNKNDSVFVQFLKDSWEEFEVFYNETEEPPKPVIRPEVIEETVPELKELKPAPPDSAETRVLPDDKTEQKSAEPSGKSGRAILNIDFYGTKTNALHPGSLPVLEQINAENIESYFEKACNMVAVSEFVQELRETKNRMRLNDWGFYKLVEQAARSLESAAPRQVLFAWVILLKSGYNVKAGFTDEEVFLMLPANEEIFSSYYLNIDEKPYYIQTSQGKNNPLPRLRVHRTNYPGNISLSMRLTRIPLLESNIMTKVLQFRNDTINIGYNKWLAEFYSEYPLCDMAVYFSAPLSGEVLQSLEKYFKPIINGKTDWQKVAILLDFVQNAFDYKTDGEQFGLEKYFFPDEVFYYPFSDCEDRSVLFARLVTYFTEFDCIGLDFPGHVNTAVHFPEEIEDGSFVRYNSKKYMICDPTYINAPIGYLASEYEKYQPKIITFDK